jgi:signal transduction histidine kinase
VAPASAARALDAIAFLAGRGAWGIAWLDQAFRTVDHYGPLAERLGIRAGVPIHESVVALVGLEEEILALQAADGATVAVPGVRIVGPGDDVRVDLSIHWRPDARLYLLVAVPTMSTGLAENGAYLAESRLRRMAEAEVAAQAEVIARTNRDLAAANRDLEEFASVISHDLRAPLRGIRYAASDARDALAAGDPAAALAQIGLVLERSQRMSGMLSGLLAYARIGRKSEALEPVETARLAAEIAATAAEGTRFTVVVAGNWPTVVTATEPLDIVIRNLVDNAVKHHDRDDGTAVLCCEPGEDGLIISVSDDGPGIPEAWHAAIFEPFRQVADSSVSGGAGIGLALVKKTVERTGGAISVHSGFGTARGTTFRVVWPLGQGD